MSGAPPPFPNDDPSPGARRLARGITATWWYTVSAILGIEAMLVPMWLALSAATGASPAALVVIPVGAVVWVTATASLLLAYRTGEGPSRGARGLRLVLPLFVSAAYGVALAVALDSWMLALMPLAQALVLLRWPPGIRLRVAVLVVTVLVLLVIVDRAMLPEDEGAPWWVVSLYAAALPVLSVSSLWWWDVLTALDRARISEARLAATQERLRVATDVHDLQGHHLQVIALQLELADRLLPDDPEAAVAQVRAARGSVAEATQGTRELAVRMRSAPLSDELANAGDLLRAAGLAVSSEISPQADRAPADVLGPVVQETTTNVLKHGAGGSARLALTDQAGTWRYEISNTCQAHAEPADDGSGIEGMRRRVSEAGGVLEVRRADGSFTVVVTVPHGGRKP